MNGLLAHLLRSLRSRWRALGAAGGITVEFALVLPVLLTASLGSIDIADFVIAHQKIQRVAVAGADLVAQAEDITTSELGNIWAGMKQAADPLPLSTQGKVIITSVSRNTANTANIINWQRTYGSLTGVTSAVGSMVGGTATVPANTTNTSNNYTLVVCEVTYEYSPPLVGWILVDPKRIKHQAYFRARLGSLKTVGS